MSEDALKQYLTFGLDREIFALDIDKVREVIDISRDAIEPPPSLGSSLDASYIEGLGHQGEQFIISSTWIPCSQARRWPCARRLMPGPPRPRQRLKRRGGRPSFCAVSRQGPT